MANNSSSKPKYAPVNGAVPTPQIEMADQGDVIPRGPSQFNTRQILEVGGVATPRGSGSIRRIPSLQPQVSQHLPVQDKVWNKVNKLVFWVYLALAVASLALMFMGIFGSTALSWIAMLAIIAITWVGSILGMWATYLTGTFEARFYQICFLENRRLICCESCDISLCPGIYRENAQRVCKTNRFCISISMSMLITISPLTRHGNRFGMHSDVGNGQKHCSPVSALHFTFFLFYIFFVVICCHGQKWQIRVQH